MLQAASPPDVTLALPAHQCRMKDVPVDDLYEAPFSDAASTRTAVGKSIARPSLPWRRILHADDTNGSSMDTERQTRHPLRRSRTG
ncbi:hypothetical protein D3M96_05730 [Alcaligenes aquatilis]|uniref:Uncharacterized protein n=1 Tax=Alcaligenes aquatilis TaxID=323284 RepID=A0A3G2HSQ0_9BURK|nr:hypothetical protein D3M96_05730 [Alcaligenes aquatilis]